MSRDMTMSIGSCVRRVILACARALGAENPAPARDAIASLHHGRRGNAVPEGV
jgi:hypothetical protein